MSRLIELGLEHPMINASGTFDLLAARRVFGSEVFDRLPFSAYVTKTITVAPRAGNPPPRLWELPGGLMNSIGLPNKGIERWLAEDLPELRRAGVPLIANVMGFSTAELVSLVERVSGTDSVVAIELNVSCPNVETGAIIGSDPKECAATVAAVRPLTQLPLIVKLTPNAADPAAVAAAAEASGADAVSLINTLRGMALDPSTREPWLGGRTGGVSGPAVRAVALAQVQAVSERTDLGIIAMGGVSSGRDARDLLDCGADLVAIGTENFRDPLAAERIRRELASLTS
jgi:dihydroorotate dehydrogenase (NAD+) catalytic subunit